MKYDFIGAKVTRHMQVITCVLLDLASLLGGDLMVISFLILDSASLVYM